MPPRVYCEHGALNKFIRKLQTDGVVELVHFPYDPDSQSRRLHDAAPSKAQIRDLNLPISELPGEVSDYHGSVYYDRILRIIGANNRRDALHVDSAVKSNCVALITVDSDILEHRDELEDLLPLRFFHPERDLDLLRHFFGLG